MDARTLIEFLDVMERMKDNTRHSWTSGGRHESVAEHSWRTALMALLMKDEFAQADIDKVIRMCLLHDIGEAVTGDILPLTRRRATRQPSGRRSARFLTPCPRRGRRSFARFLRKWTRRRRWRRKSTKRWIVWRRFCSTTRRTYRPGLRWNMT